jgi:RNA-directed DNA polymerase
MAFPLEDFINESKKQGRSEKFIEETLKYIDFLTLNKFPVIFSLPHFAIELGLTSDQIKFIIENPIINYTYYKLQKKDKKKAPREIMAPKEELKFIQRWINFNILHKCSYENNIKGFVPGTSILQNAQIHEGSKFLLKIDLLKFFDTITEDRVYNIFVEMGYVKNLSRYFAKLCTTKHRKAYWKSFDNSETEILKHLIMGKPSVLPQGAPTSPLLSNLAARTMDTKIKELLSKKACKYSRYADDLCFSANDLDNLPSIRDLKKIIESEGFYINEEKIKLNRRGTKQYVTGLTIANEVNIPKAKRKEIFKHLYFAHKYGPASHISRLKEGGFNHQNFQDWILGHISFNYSINQKIGKKMFSIYNKINWGIE